MDLGEVLGSSTNGDRNGERKKQKLVFIAFEIGSYLKRIEPIAHNWKLVQNGSTERLDVYSIKVEYFNFQISLNTT